MTASQIQQLPYPYDDLDLGVDNFPVNGCANFGRILNREKCADLRAWINERRPLKPSIFYQSPEEFAENGRWQRYAPGPGHNLLEGEDLSFIEEDPAFQEMASKIVGPGYSVMKRAVIRSVPKAFIPEWILRSIDDVGRPNLNPFVHDELQDVQYFFCTDFHQDKTRPTSHFTTFYVYLDEVDADYSALRLLLGSHTLGMTSYPHSLRRSNTDKSKWYYSDGRGRHTVGKETVVTGAAGHVSCFHGLTLHGTPWNDSSDPRISIRYLLSPDPDYTGPSLFNKANDRIIGDQDIPVPRADVDENGAFLPIGSSLASYD